MQFGAVPFVVNSTLHSDIGQHNIDGLFVVSKLEGDTAFIRVNNNGITLVDVIGVMLIRFFCFSQLAITVGCDIHGVNY